MDSTRIIKKTSIEPRNLGYKLKNVHVQDFFDDFSSLKLVSGKSDMMFQYS
jgi:hypothetical protein